MAKRIKEKAAKIAETREKRPHAHVKNIRISPFKARAVIDTVRGKSVNEAIAILESTPKSTSPVVLKLIKSATANAEHNMGIARIDLYIAAIYADPGPTLKRAMPRAKGRSYAILKRTCHISVILDVKGNSLLTSKLEDYHKPVPKKTEKKEIEPKAKTSAAKKPAAAKKPITTTVKREKTETAAKATDIKEDNN
ncbi:MAG: 50S ribosomal protein L22 [Firmicutes bacterium]|nr:50S ribosomal protein L22 [Bacillota bacterium]